ncbi:MAG: redoxin domain-containing protein [Candidatus Cyclonatronum sp.]|uniref:thioredoxin family protein n=1 Tax=Cyclonatronum sp. TaxID=3024185 RepID=UPI0025BE2D5A|nr:redoxin domain-containing protein [Cyclonatronum sp.]MCH8487826.1 redoxin domain-containing protein [Cyclonatronum sp.]
MKKLAYIIAILLFTGLFSELFAGTGENPQSPPIGEAAPEFTLVNQNGEEVSLSDFRGSFVVLEWLNHDCPFVRKFYNAGEMQRLQRHYAEEGVVWLSIISSREGEQGHLTQEQARQAMATHNSAQHAILIDEPGIVGRAYNARTTPHMFVIDPDGILLYDGAIDSVPSANPDTIAEADNFLVAALDAAMAGEPVAIPTTRPYGCSVKY